MKDSSFGLRIKSIGFMDNFIERISHENHVHGSPILLSHTNAILKG